MTDDDIAEQKQWAMDRAAAIIKEHFENGVIIAASPIPNDRTLKLTHHFGDVYSCIGMAATFAKGQVDYLNGLRE